MDLTTTYMGLTLKNPIVPSASPLSKSWTTSASMEDAGAAAITMYSLFEEQIEFEAACVDALPGPRHRELCRSAELLPGADEYNLGPEEYLEHIHQAKDAVDIPVIASLNGVSDGGWIDYASRSRRPAPTRWS